MTWFTLCPSARTDYTTGLKLTLCVQSAFPVYLSATTWHAPRVLAGTGRP